MLSQIQGCYFFLTFTQPDGTRWIRLNGTMRVMVQVLVHLIVFNEAKTLEKVESLIGVQCCH